MKVLLIWAYKASDNETMPLCYLYMIPILKRKGFDVKFLDCSLYEIPPDSERFRQIIIDYNPDVVGISAWSVHKQMATYTLKVVKSINPKIITIAGGPHFTGSANYSILSDKGTIDYVLKGEGELTFPKFLETISKSNFTEDDLQKIQGLCFIKSDGTVHETPLMFPPSLDDFGQPNYSEINLFGYIKNGYHYRAKPKMQAPILTTRGCPYTCDFCEAPYLNGRGIRKHSLLYLKKLIENLYDNYRIRHFNIIDDNFTFDTFYAKAFCKMIIDNKHRFKGISFGTPNGIRVDRTDQQLFYLMKGAGWNRLMVAPESGSPKMLEKMSKHLDLSIVPEKTRQIQKAGLEVEAFFIVGHPGEDRQTIQETKNFLKLMKPDMAQFSFFQPLVGTPIFYELLQRGEISKDFDMTSYSDINWIPKNWTKEELFAVILDLKKTMATMYFWRFERILAKHTILGKLLEKIKDKHYRFRWFMRIYYFRKQITDVIYKLKHGAELNRQINQVVIDEGNAEEKRRRENRLKEYEKEIMEKSDRLLDMRLNDCNIIVRDQIT